MSKKNENSLFLTVAEAAKLLSVSPVTLYRWCESGQFPSKKIGGKRFISRAYMESLADLPVSESAEV
jgi:excisionase family DNA binding protein